MTGRATASSFSHQPFTEGVALDLRNTYNPEELELLRRGFVPESMDDKWFVYHELPYLYFHRNGSGVPVYRIQLEETPDGATVVEALAAPLAADPETGAEAYIPEGEDLAYESKLLDYLIGEILLGQDKPFPEA